MRGVILAFAMLTAGVACGQTVTVTTSITTAQSEADTMARTGVLRHCGRQGPRREGIAFSTVSPDAAIRSCCFYRDVAAGRLRIVDRGVAWSPVRRGWFAVIWVE